MTCFSSLADAGEINAVINNATNAWVRNVTDLHFAYSLVGTQRGAKWITVQDCISREPVSRKMGGQKVYFSALGTAHVGAALHIRQGTPLVHDGSTNVEWERVPGLLGDRPILFERTATGRLYDNVRAPLTARFWKNISIGWAGDNTVFWNCEGPFLVQKPPTAQNFSFGHIGVNLNGV